MLLKEAIALTYNHLKSKISFKDVQNMKCNHVLRNRSNSHSFDVINVYD